MAAGAHNRLCINSQGEVYVPDSEEEEADMDPEDVAAEGPVPVMLAAVRSAGAAAATDMGPAAVVAADGAPAIEMSVDRNPGMELAPEVQARLEAVLAGIDPRDHDFFISMYKIPDVDAIPLQQLLQGL